MNIAVFCSQYEVAEKYKEAAESVARLIAERGHALVWGGADEGLMGLIATTAKRGGSRIVGVIRDPIKDKAHAEADEMHIVPNAHEMNLGIINRSDAVIALPGGIGTLNELTELIRMNKNGQHAKPVAFVSVDGFYDGFRQQLERMREEGFIKKEVLKCVHFADTPKGAMEYAEASGM